MTTTDTAPVDPDDDVIATRDRITEFLAREGFIVIYPDGTGRPGWGKRHTWNAGRCCGWAATCSTTRRPRRCGAAPGRSPPGS